MKNILLSPQYQISQIHRKFTKFDFIYRLIVKLTSIKKHQTDE